MKFYEGAGLLTFREKISKRTLIHAINQSIYHNFRQSILENVNHEQTKNNFYFVNGHKNKIDQDKGYEAAKKYRRVNGRST